MWFLSIRHLLAQKQQSALTLLGIILGSAAYVVISGMMMGFQTFIIDQLVNNDSHIRISARDQVIEPGQMTEYLFGPEQDSGVAVKWLRPPSGKRDSPYINYPRGWIDRLEKDERVEAYSPQLVLQGLVRVGQKATGVRIIGSEPFLQERVTTIQKYMVEGRFADISGSGNRIVVGEPLLKNLGAGIRDTLFLTVGSSGALPFKVVGSFRLGVKTLDETTIFAYLPDVQKLNRTSSRVSDIAVRLTDVREASALATHWGQFSNDKVQSWDQSNEGIMSVFKTQDIVRNTMTISILVVAGFGIYNILSIAVTHKRKEIAILRSMGYEPQDIVRLFLVQGVLLGAIGGIVGMIIGYGLCEVMATIEVSPDRGLGGNRMMVSFSGWIYVRAFLLAFGSAAVAGYLPSRAAGRLEPIEIIRTEAT